MTDARLVRKPGRDPSEPPAARTWPPRPTPILRHQLYRVTGAFASTAVSQDGPDRDVATDGPSGSSDGRRRPSHAPHTESPPRPHESCGASQARSLTQIASIP